MANRTAIESYNVHARVLELLANGTPVKEVGRVLGLDPKSVRRYRSLPLPQIDPSALMESALNLKAARPDFGPHQVLDVLAQVFSFDRNDAPISEAVIKNAIRANGLARRHQFNRTGEDRPKWWLCDYDRPLRCFQVDTVKVVLKSRQQVEILSAQDVHSRAVWLEVLPRDGSLVYAMSRVFQALGVPEMISTDNGMGWNLDWRNKLSDVASYCLEQGVKQFHFIPVAAPWYNGIVERFHGTLKRGGWIHDGVRECETIEDVSRWINRELAHHNTVKTHSAISKGNKGRYTPAFVHGCYNHLEVQAHRFTMRSARSVTSGTIGYTRMADSRGFCRVDAPSMVFQVPSPSAWGNMFRFELDVMTGEGRAFLCTASGLELVGTFKHEINGVKGDGYMRVELLPSAQFEPLPYDEAVELERERKHIRKGHRLPLPSGFNYEDLGGGEWLVRNKSGHVVTTSQHLIVDHRSEVLGDGW